MSMRSIAILIVLATGYGLTVLPDVAADGSSPPNRPDIYRSGIAGRVVIGPTCPMAREASCEDQPYEATIVIQTPSRTREVGRFRSGKHGTFRVSLRPGTYLLVPLSPGPFPRAQPQTVVVKRDRFTQVVIRYDTGIR